MAAEPARERSFHVPAGIRDARSYSPELESLRGVACLLVFLFHASGTVDSGAQGVGPLRAFVYAGHTGVTLFFVLSAFLLSRPFLAQARGGPRVRWGASGRDAPCASCRSTPSSWWLRASGMRGLPQTFCAACPTSYS